MFLKQQIRASWTRLRVVQFPISPALSVWRLVSRPVLHEKGTAGLAELQPQFRFVLFDELRLPVDLEGPGNLMSAIAALEQGSASVETFAQAVRAAGSWLGSSPPELRRIFYAWITRVLAATGDSEFLDAIDDLGDLKDMMEERIANWKVQIKAEALEEGREVGLELGREEGREAGRAEGRRLGEAEILKRLLRLKFGELPNHVLAQVDSGADSDLIQWADRVLTADSLDEVFSD